MIQEVNSSTYQYPSTLDELVDDMEQHPDRYQHLQFILNREKHHNLGLGQKYLVVNRVGFGLYELISVYYHNGIICLIFIIPDTGNQAEICLDVNDKHPELFLINWKDIEDMSYSMQKQQMNNKQGQELLQISGTIEHQYLMMQLLGQKRQI